MVNGQGVWTPAFYSNKENIANLGLLEQEEVKNRKHGLRMPKSDLLSCYLLRHVDETRQRWIRHSIHPLGLSIVISATGTSLPELDTPLPELQLWVFFLCLDYLFLLPSTVLLLLGIDLARLIVCINILYPPFPFPRILLYVSLSSFLSLFISLSFTPPLVLACKSLSFFCYKLYDSA